jgi:hypothetical protein
LEGFIYMIQNPLERGNIGKYVGRGWNVVGFRKRCSYGASSADQSVTWGRIGC